VRTPPQRGKNRRQRNGERGNHRALNEETSFEGPGLRYATPRLRRTSQSVARIVSTLARGRDCMRFERRQGITSAPFRRLSKSEVRCRRIAPWPSPDDSPQVCSSPEERRSRTGVLHHGRCRAAARAGANVAPRETLTRGEDENGVSIVLSSQRRRADRRVFARRLGRCTGCIACRETATPERRGRRHAARASAATMSQKPRTRTGRRRRRRSRAYPV